jgi:hypothetical protein
VINIARLFISKTVELKIIKRVWGLSCVWHCRQYPQDQGMNCMDGRSAQDDQAVPRYLSNRMSLDDYHINLVN